MPPPQHPAFFASSRLTLNITRQAMAAMGWCPSGRLFEAAACGAPILTDSWDGLDDFYTPGRSCWSPAAPGMPSRRIDLADAELRRIAGGARAHLAEHTADQRRPELEDAAAGRHRAGDGRLSMWGIIPAAGLGSRIQPLAFSKELLPVGSRLEAGSSARARSAST